MPGRGPQHDGTYAGQLCNQLRDRKPVCWPVELVVRDGAAQASWLSRSTNTSTASGVVTGDGKPMDGLVVGHLEDGALTGSGRWRSGIPVAGRFERAA
jgi:hypothetical protein